MNRLVPGLVVLACVACQCFVPVDERDGGLGVDGGVPDAGVDGGVPDGGLGADGGVHDGGLEADGGVECQLAGDCRGTPWATRWCGPDAGGFSCVAGRCVSSCAGPGQTCVVDAGAECATCGADPFLCVADDCPTAAFSRPVSSVECRAGVTPPFRGGDALSFVPIRGASCELSVSAPGRGLGQAFRARSGPRHFWFVRELGGWCVGEELPTGLVRSEVACPLCTFVVEGL